MRIFLDTNVVLDIPLQRAGSTASRAVFDRCLLPENLGFVAWHTLATVHYVVSRATNRATANGFLSDLVVRLDVGPATTDMARRALSLGFRDTEDALQYVVAEQVQADVVITRNGRDYVLAAVPIQTPEEFLARHP